MEPSKERYNELCRLCASYDAVKMDIFGNEGKNRQLVDKIQTCLPFKIAEDDRLPKCLCYRCMYNLENFYDFRTACVNAVALLERCLPPGNNATGKQIENGVESYSELRSELLKEKEKMPILIPEAPIVNPNAALGTPPRLNSDGEGEPEIEEIHNVSGTEDGVAKESVFATNASFEDTDDRKSDEYEMDMETNPSDFLEMTPMVTEEMDETSVKKSQASKTRNIIETFQHTSEQHEVYVCSLCNKAFSSKGHLSLHARIHVGAGDVIGAKVVTDDHTSYKRPYQCDLCNKSYSTAKHRWGHVSTTHRGHPAVTCAYCSRIYSTRTNLEEHIKSRHTGLPPPPELPVAYVQPDNRYRCKTCPKMYTNVTDLNKHTRVCAADVAIKEKQQQQQQRPVKKIPRKNKSRVDTSDISSSSGTTDTEDESNNDYRNAEAKLSKNPQLTILKQALTKGGENLKRDYEDRRNQANAGGGDNKPPAAKVPRIENSEGPARKRWYCEMCPQNFTSVEKLKQHEMIHDAERPYVCILCEKDFVLKTSLSRHIVSSHGVDPTPILESDKCTKKGALAQSWRKKLIKTEEVKGRCKREAPSDSSEDADSFAHGNMVEIETVFVCEICTRDFNDRASLWLHIRATHKEFAAFACGVCLKICSDNAQLLNHVNMYHGGSKLLVSEQRRYSCTICGRQHDSRKKLITHVSIHNVDPGYDPASFVQLNANYYNESFNSNEPNDHLMDFDPEDGDKVDCYICYKSFPNEDHLIRHQRNAHKSEGVAPSNQVTIPSNNGPASVAVPGLNGTKAQYHLFFVCELCGSSHPSKWERWLHVSGNHSEDPSMRCEREDCGKIFATKALRNEHAQHHLIQGSSPNTCEVCGKLWGSRVDYWKHVMGVHSDTVPLICGVCLKVFPDVAKLSSHVKTSHWPLTNGDFSCDICGRPYSNKSKMSRHRKIHGVVEVDPTLGNSGDTGGRATAAGDIRNETRAYCGEKSPKEVELTCELCTDMSFENWQSLCNHRRMIHGLFPCDLCNKCYGRTSHLWKHVNRVHKGHEDVTCRYCMKTSASKDHLMAHIAKIHRYEPENKLEMMMVVGEAAAAVVTTVTGEEEEEEEEEENGDEEQETRKRRRRRKGGEASSLGMIGEDDEAGGGGSGVHHCDKCQKSFHKRYLLRRHMKGCQNYRKDPGALLTRCRACERIFKDRASLQKHIENHHSEYTCHLCNETVTSKLGIMTHNRVNHLHHPDLTCENGNCRKLFRTKEDLESHRKDHKYHNSPNVCDFCGDTVENKLKLKMHVLSLHRNEIGVSCGVCLIPMKDPKDLKKHVEDEHEGVLHKPNTCQVCGKRYASKWKAFDHTKKCHGKVFRTCKQCLAVFTTDTDIRHHYEHVHNVPKDQLAGFENRLLDSRTEDCDAIVKDEPEDYEYEVHRDGSTGVGLCDENEGFDFKRRKSSGGGGLGKNHRDTHDCEICPEIFLNRVTLSDHYRNVHNTDPERMYKRIKLERDEGGRFISSSATGSSKRMMMRERENFECQNCSRQFCTKSLFWNHTNVCTRRNSANRDDPRSSASFGQSSSILEAHLKNNNRIKKEPSDVPGLDETNLNIPDFNLFEDINMQLSEQKPIPNLMPLSELRRGGGVGGGSSTAGGLLLLPSSNEKSMRKDSRKDSRKVYDESTNTVCICEVCGKQWPAKKHLWQHLIRFHRAEAAVTCGVCLKLCTNYEQLGQHLRTTHESVLSREGNNFTCKTCGRYHNARSKLLLHMSIHINNDNGGATCWCPKCEKSFENEEKLHEHGPACDKSRPAIFEEHSIDIDTDREIKIEDDKGSLIGDGASLSGEDEEEVDFSDQRVRRNSENSVNSESSRGGARTHSDSDSSEEEEEEDEDEDEEEEDSESRTNSRATGAATCHSETEVENDIREKSPVDIPPSISPEDAKSNSDDASIVAKNENSKSTTNTPETKQEQKVAKDKEQADEGIEAPTQVQVEAEQSPVSLTKNLETNGSSTVLEPITQGDNDNVDDEDEDDDDGPPILSPMMPLSSENANQERDDLASHRLSPMLSLNGNEEISAVPMATETTEAVKETNGTAESCSPKDQQFYEDDDCGERSNEELASDEEHEEETLEDENEELDDEDSRIHVVNPDDEYHSDDDRPPEDNNDQGGEEEEEEEEDEDDREEPGLENDGEDEEEQEQEEVEAEEEEEERGMEENLEMHQEEEALEEMEEEEEMMEDDNDVVDAEEEEEEEEEAEDEELTAENSLQIHNLDGTVLMVANDADGNQILIQRNVSDMENDESIGALTGYIYEDDDDEYDFTGFQVEDGGIEVEEARRVTGEDSEEEEEEEEEGDEDIILVPDEDEREIPEAENEKEPEQDYPDESNQEEMEVRIPAKNYDNDRVGQDPSAT